MNNGRIIGLVLLLVGAALLFYGFSASESVSSEFSELFQGAPSNKAIWLLIAGAVVAVIGIVQLARGRRAT